MKTINKKLSGACIAFIVLFFVTATSFAALNDTAAEEIARKWVPAEAEHVATKVDSREYEVEFFNKTTQEKYEIEINLGTEAVTEVKTKVVNNRGSRIQNLDEIAAQNIVLREFPGASIRRVKLENDNGLLKYEVKFIAGSLRGEMEINPETGVIIERKVKY